MKEPLVKLSIRSKARVIRNEPLSTMGRYLVFERNGLEFKAGQVITLHGRTTAEDRSFTLAAGEGDEHLAVLYRVIPQGKLTPQLANLKEGDEVLFSGPYGEFTLHDPAAPMVFVATGTGVAPCVAYVRSKPDLRLTLIHGVRGAEDLFFRKMFEPYDYHPCVSQEKGVGFHGRVTTFFKTFPADPEAHYHLCGGNEMIFDMHGLLKDRGIDDSHIHTEAYYYRLYS
jgi:ferredoxin-NADP reductase